MFRKSLKFSVDQLNDHSTHTAEKYSRLESPDRHTILRNVWNGSCDINSVDRHGNRPLHYLAELGNLDKLITILDKGADINAAGKEGLTALMLAVSNGHTEIISCLIERGANLALINTRGETIFHLSTPYPKCLQTFFKHSLLSDINAQNMEGKTPLMYACACNEDAAVELLLNQGADMKLSDANRKTALHWAVIKDSLKSVVLLLQHGAAVDVSDEDGQTPYYYAISLGRQNILSVLILAGCDRTAIDGLMGTGLALAAMRGHANVVEVLTQAGDDPDEIGYFGMTPLMLASYGGHIDAVNALLSSGADPNMVSRMGGIALRAAMLNIFGANVEMRHKVIAALLKNGADPNATNAPKFLYAKNSSCCKSTIVFAIHSGYISIVKMLLISGVDCYNSKLTIEPEVDARRFVSPVKIFQLISEWGQNPLSLAHCSRMAVRKCLLNNRPARYGVLRAVSQLPIAPYLKSYVNFEEFDSLLVEQVELTDAARVVQNMGRNGCQFQALRQDFDKF